MGSGSISGLRSMNGSVDVNKLMGKDVKGINGQTVGTIKDFEIAPNRHVFALLSDTHTGGSMGWAIGYESKAWYWLVFPRSKELCEISV
jgi:hypothetical protein